jgi:hypothetical protein
MCWNIIETGVKSVDRRMQNVYFKHFYLSAFSAESWNLMEKNIRQKKKI